MNTEEINMKKTTVAVGMSGGVDSSVTALLLKKMGYNVIGMFMKNWEESAPDGICTTQADFDDVARVCEILDIPYYRINFTKEYWDEVFCSFLQDLKSGLTPNPDVLCNQKIKFHFFLKKALLLGADKLATGHYAKISNGSLEKACDGNKDQTYFLYRIPKKQLQSVIFPLGDLTKQEVRDLAKRHNLPVHNKKDSTGICFIGKRNFKDFVQNYISPKSGNFVTLDGRKIGTHAGACFYTIGQRKGLGIGGPGEAWFVAGKNMNTNEVYVVQGKDHPALFSDCLIAGNPHFIDMPLQKSFHCKAKIRYRQEDQPCKVITAEDGKLHVYFSLPQRAVTPGQSVVFYQGEKCLGGAVIEKQGPTYYEMGKYLHPEHAIQAED
ncbi:MAG: tRNA 2-thiouridine(34) synthase MnmA [Simkaniaceae bacterium]